MSGKTYICIACQASAAPREARAACYRCPQCRKGYLVARQDSPRFIQVVRPTVAAEPTPTPVSHSVTLEDAPVTVDAALRAALSAQREAKALPVSSSEVETPPLAVPERPAMDNRQSPDSPSENSVVLVLPPPYNEIDAAAMEQLAGTLDRLPSPIGLEIAGEHGQRRLLIRGAPQAVKRIVHQLYRVYRQIGIEPLSHVADPAISMVNSQGVVRAACLHPARPEFLSLKTWREFEGNDPLGLLLGAFDGLKPGERALSQMIIRGAAPERWADPHLRQLVALKRRGYGTDAPAPTRNIIGFAGGATLLLIGLSLSLWSLGDWHRWFVTAPILFVLCPAAFWLFSLSGNQWTTALDEEAIAKLRDQAFQVELRLFAAAQTAERADEIVNQLIAAYQLFNTTAGNRFHMVRPKDAVSPVDLSPMPSIKPALLSVKEVAGLWHMPVGESLDGWPAKRTSGYRHCPSTSPIRVAFISACRGKAIRPSPCNCRPRP